MQEVEAICDRVIIINKGKIVANKTINELHKNKDNRNIITIEFSEKTTLEDLKAIEHVLEVKEIGTNQYQITSDSKHDLRKRLFEYAVAKEHSVLQMNMKEDRLEDVFHRLTN